MAASRSVPTLGLELAVYAWVAPDRRPVPGYIREGCFAEWFKEHTVKALQYLRTRGRYGMQKVCPLQGMHHKLGLSRSVWTFEEPKSTYEPCITWGTGWQQHVPDSPTRKEAEERKQTDDW
jgi:hypothetical protein